MKTLITQDVEQRLRKYPLYSQDGKGKDAEVVVKFFLPHTAWAWYILEAQPIDIDEAIAKDMGIEAGKSWEFFGITINDSTPHGEYGYMTLAELQRIKIDVPIVDAKTGRRIGSTPAYVERDDTYIGKRVADIDGVATYDEEEAAQP